MQTLSSSIVTQDILPTWDFSISSKEDSIDSLSNMSNQRFTVLTEVFPCVHMGFLCFNLCSFPLVLSWSTRKESFSLFSISAHQVFVHMDKIPPKPSLLQGEQSQISQPFLIPLYSLLWPCTLLFMDWAAKNVKHYSRSALAFLTLSLQVQITTLCSSWVTHP